MSNVLTDESVRDRLCRVTPKYALVQTRLGRDLGTYLAEARAAGRNWRQIAADLSAVTSTPVTHETVRAWHSLSEKAAS